MLRNRGPGFAPCAHGVASGLFPACRPGSTERWVPKGSPVKRQPTSYARFQLPVEHFEAVVELASAWTRGVPPFQKYRSSRRRAGLPDDMDARELRTDTWLEDGDLFLRSYGDDEVWAVQFRHPQKNRPEVIWETVMLVDRIDGPTDFTQLTTRSTRRGSFTASRAALVTALVDRYSPHLQSQLLSGEPDVLWHPGEVARYVKTVLDTPGRTVPVVAVSRHKGNGPMAVDSGALARCMVGSALVVELATGPVAHAWSNTLESLGFDPRMGCYNGAVRQYLPDLAAHAGRSCRPGHRLYRYERLCSLSEGHRVETVAGAFLQDFVGPQIEGILDRVEGLLDAEE